MATVQEELTKLGKEIESAKKSIATLEGRKAEVLSRMMKDFGVKSVDEAEKLLDKMDGELTELDLSIQKDFNSLKEKFSW